MNTLKKVLFLALIFFFLALIYFLWYLSDGRVFGLKFPKRDDGSLATTTLLASKASSTNMVSISLSRDKASTSQTIVKKMTYTYEQAKTFSTQVLNSRLNLSGEGLVSFKNGFALRGGDNSWVMDEPKFGDLNGNGDPEAVVVINHSQGGQLVGRSIVVVGKIMTNPTLLTEMTITEPTEIYSLLVKDGLVWLDSRSGTSLRGIRVYQLQNGQLASFDQFLEQ